MALSAEEKLRLLLQGSAPATSAVVSTSGLPGSTGVSSSKDKMSSDLSIQFQILSPKFEIGALELIWIRIHLKGQGHEI